MATSDGSKKIDAGEPARRARTAAEQRAERAAGSKDPEVLAEEIERTREELAETLDAIADKVSPKRVTARTKKKVADSVKDKADAAKEHLHAGAVSAKESAEHAKEAVQEKAEHAKEAVQEKAEHAKEAVQDKAEQVQGKVSGSDAGTDPGPATVVAPTAGVLADRADTAALVEPAGADLPPATVPTGPPVGVTTYGASSPGMSREVLAGAAAALAVVLLLLRRRRSSRERGWRDGARR